MKRDSVAFLLNYQDVIADRWERELVAEDSHSNLRQMVAVTFEETNRAFIQFIVKLVELEQGDVKGQMSVFAEPYIERGWPLSYFTKGLQALEKVILCTLSEQTNDMKQFVDTFSDINNWVDEIIDQLVQDYTGSWENIVEIQKLSLLELSAPLIPVIEGVTVMPLIGTIDTARAKLIMENLLEGVIKHRSTVVLIDITGVPVVDTMVAQHIIRASEAVRLVGATCILVGIRPEIAQTIINLGIDLSQFPTRSSMKKGIECALELIDKKLIDL